MQPEYSLPCSQKPATRPYPEPAEGRRVYGVLVGRTEGKETTGKT